MRVMSERGSQSMQVGESPEFQMVSRAAGIVAGTDTTVLVLGESGTGKELLARQLHDNSPRRRGPWVAVNCAALPTELTEAELFGYRKGAFTGAECDSGGYVHQADGGTLFLDEIAEMPLAGQSKLLRFLEQGECQRLGASRPERLNVRVIAATHQDLGTLVAQGRFRSDLFYRLNIVPLELPPLRERTGDVRLLAERFLTELAQSHGVEPPALASSALRRLRRYSWPGNVRELRNLIERCVIFMAGQSVEAADLPDAWFNEVQVPEPELPVSLPPEGVDLAEVEVSLIRQALQRVDGNRTHAARLLGLTRDTLLYRLRKYELTRNR